MNVRAKNCAPEWGLIVILQLLIQALQGAVFSRVIYHPVHRIQDKLSTTLAKPFDFAQNARRHLNSQEIH